MASQGTGCVLLDKDETSAAEGVWGLIISFAFERNSVMKWLLVLVQDGFTQSKKCGIKSPRGWGMLRQVSLRILNAESFN